MCSLFVQAKEELRSFYTRVILLCLFFSYAAKLISYVSCSSLSLKSDNVKDIHKLCASRKEPNLNSAYSFRYWLYNLKYFFTIKGKQQRNYLRSIIIMRLYSGKKEQRNPNACCICHTRLTCRLFKLFPSASPDESWHHEITIFYDLLHLS